VKKLLFGKSPSGFSVEALSAEDRLILGKARFEGRSILAACDGDKERAARLEKVSVLQAYVFTPEGVQHRGYTPWMRRTH
jgi:hypothetical protein